MPPSHTRNTCHRLLQHPRIVEEHVSDAPAEQDAERSIEDEVIGMLPRHRRAGLPDQPGEIPPADQDAADIAERIPADRQRPEMDGHRRQMEAGELDVARSDCGKADEAHVRALSGLGGRWKQRGDESPSLSREGLGWVRASARRKDSARAEP
jgi:hypothetical protein